MWFITVFEKIDPVGNRYAKTGSHRTWGYFSNREWAVEALHRNETDMWEFCYDYAVLEKFEEGLVPIVLERQFFKFDRGANGYFEIDEPECLKGLVNFGIG